MLKNNHDPILTLEEAKAVVAKEAMAPRVTETLIKDKIGSVIYLKHEHLTICIITMENGFMVTGQSAPANASNYNAKVGQTYAYENAFKQLWVLEGYLLREILYTKAIRGVETGL
jgi:hypothetical protein